MLRLLVAGAASGLFSLSWEAACPMCKGMGSPDTTLGGLAQEHQCGHCGHGWHPHLDDEVHVRATLNELVRLLAPPRRDNPAFRQATDQRLGPVSALALMHVPAFRELVADAMLPEGQSLGVRQMSIFFSDLRGSTALYHRLGDSAAYAMVRDHFKALFGVVAAEGGSAVKTMGDGVMGTFPTPAAALRAVAAAHGAMAALNAARGLEGSEGLALKIGLHLGSAIVVTLNGRLDYFGETVNIAARLGQQASGGETILSEAILADGEAAALARQLGTLTPLERELRGLPGLFQLWRWQLHPQPLP